MSATGSDRPLPTDCVRCPLPLPLPDQLSDAAVAQLVESLYLFATAIENGYYRRLRRYYASQREHDDSTTGRQQQQPSTRTSAMTICRSDRQRHPGGPGGCHLPPAVHLDDDAASGVRRHAALFVPLHRPRQNSGTLADRELPSQRGILRRPDRRIPTYQTAGTNTTRSPPNSAGFLRYRCTILRSRPSPVAIRDSDFPPRQRR